MKIVITGHTKGIGQGLYNYYNNINNIVIGFSRSNGFDINDLESQDAIINETQNADIFINNAYFNDAQNALTDKWFEKNKNRNCLIVNMSSITVEAMKYGKHLDNSLFYENYTKQKSDLNDKSWTINFSGSNAKALIVTLGVVDTEMAHPMLKDQFREKGILITVDDVVKSVVKGIDSFTTQTFVPHIYLFNNFTN